MLLSIVTLRSLNDIQARAFGDADIAHGAKCDISHHIEFLTLFEVLPSRLKGATPHLFIESIQMYNSVGQIEIEIPVVSLSTL